MSKNTKMFVSNLSMHIRFLFTIKSELEGMSFTYCIGSHLELTQQRAVSICRKRGTQKKHQTKCGNNRNEKRPTGGVVLEFCAVAKICRKILWSTNI